MDFTTLVSLMEEVRERIRSRLDEPRVREAVSKMLASIDLSQFTPEELAAIVALVASKLLTRYAVAWEHPCHCSAERVRERVRYTYAALVGLVLEEVNKLAEDACKEAASRCAPIAMHT
ncbi:hypothetical protein Pyrfu_1280 [Pyrolobus fumarii 1A]|uniref:Uncharacterized protein n=1 Tax=Pyrolobus fumarii (strain DSM 11204 / 1A) TaxID=694429 RepID=G0EGB4_PYRF1|nr:hypothetical protein [Pyrolobus fumarii]AEM39139.1 hypothetical protein Pyrfu_1280 [Pyrolobus fumarii 1A]